MFKPNGYPTGAIKYLVLFFVVIMQACLGGTYSWSVYDTIFINDYQIPVWLSSAPFNLFYVVFPVTLLFASKLIAWIGYQKSAILGVVLFGCGWMLASFGGSSFYITLAGVGLLGGIGVGLSYLVPIAVGVAWFPEKRGLVTGLAVGGFAGGAAMVSQLSQSLLTSGVTPFTLLGGLGIGYAVIGGLAGAFMIHPSPEKTTTLNQLPIRQLLREKLFITLFVAMTAGLAAGFFMNSKLSLMSRDYQIDLIISAVAIFAIGNAIGRLCWGWLSDLLAPATILQLNLLVQGIVIIASPVLLQSDLGATVLAGVTGFNYGGVLVLYASAVGHYWGNHAIQSIYPWLFLSNILGALINALLGVLYSQSGLLPAAGLILLLVIASLVFLRRSNSEAKLVDRLACE